MENTLLEKLSLKPAHYVLIGCYLIAYVIFFPYLFETIGVYVGLLIIPPTLLVALCGCPNKAIGAGLLSILLNIVAYSLMAPIPFFSQTNEVVWTGTIINAFLAGLIGYTRKVEFQRYESYMSIEALQNRLKQEEVMSDVIRILTSGVDLDETLDEIAKILGRFYGVPRAGLGLLNEEGTMVEILAAYHEVGFSSTAGVMIPVAGNPSVEYVMETKDVLVIADAQNDPIIAPANHLMRQHGVVSIMLIPILVDNTFVGSIGFDSPVERNFSEDEKAFGQKVASVIGNVLQRKQAEQETKDGRDFAQQIMETMGQGLVVGDNDCQIVYCNRELTNLLGVTAKKLIDRPFDSLFDKTEIDNICGQKLWREEKSQQFEASISQPNGEERFVLVDIVPRRQKEAVVGFTAVLTDLTARREIERALTHAKSNALEASRLKSEFLASMSHEIRTPLNGVIGMTSLLLETGLDLEQRDYVNTVRSSGDQLLAIINDILDFSKIEAGKLELESKSFDVRECVEDALDILVAGAAAKNLELTYRINSDVPAAIVGDVTRVRQILVNLLGNAVKFTEYGEIQVKVEAAPTENNIYEWHFMVSDTGIGIPQERMNRLFRSFSQVDSSTTRKFGGTGLGLAICKRLTELMGGRIWVDSEVGQGSTFHFTIEAPIGESVSRVYMKNLADLQNKRVLIVDDNQTNRRILRDQLDHWGVKTVEVASGFEAINLLSDDNNFDLAILDMQMPDLDGLNLARKVRTDLGLETLPLIMLTSISDRVEETDLFAAYLAKPVKTAHLHRILQTTLGQPSGVGNRAAQIAKSDDQLLGEQHPLTILLVEDNAINQKVALHLLSRLGYDADLAANGLEAIDALQRQPYKLVLMDAQMPEMDGMEATEHIRREIDPDYQPYIIALTANAMTHQKEAYLAIGMDDYLSKPVRLEDLEDALRRAILRMSKKHSKIVDAKVNF